MKHAVSIKWSKEDKGFIATIPGVRGLSAFGETQEEALAELGIAADAFFEALKRAGRPIPKEDTVVEFSGQIRLRMPRGLHAELSETAEAEGVSLNTYIVSLLSRRNIEIGLDRRIRQLQEMIYGITEIARPDAVATQYPKSAWPPGSSGVSAKSYNSRRLN